MINWINVQLNSMFAPHRYYYLHNFQRALEVVTDRYADLLDDDERAFQVNFVRLPPLSQALFVRMAMRRGPWFRASRLIYEEIPDLRAAAEPLVSLGWLDAQAPMALGELFDICTMPELRSRFAAHASPGLRKSEWLAMLREHHDDARTYGQWCPDSDDLAWRFMLGDHCDRLRLMFFGNLRQDWSEFVLADLGVFRYESVAFDTESRAFQARADIDRYLTLHACREALESDTAIDEVVAMVQACTSENTWLEQRRAKTLLRIGQACERAQDWDRAYRVYEQCAYPGARHRRIRVLERMGCHGDALELALTAQATPESEAESQALSRMLPRLRRHAGQPACARTTTPAPVRLDLTLPRPVEPLSVEYVARDHLHSDAAPVFYVENTLINSLFGLLCWQAVFAPLPGAFFHPFQRGPADLRAPDFAARRADLFAASLVQLESDAYRDTIWRHYSDKSGVQSPFVFWGTLSEPLLRMALECLPAAHLKLFFMRMLQDISHNRTGLPDLIQFWPSENRYELIEIKGPGDKLQDNQIRWLQYCSLHGIPAHVCHVQWVEDQA